MSSWWRWLWCMLDGHGGITDLRIYPSGKVYGLCKRCGARTFMWWQP